VAGDRWDRDLARLDGRAVERGDDADAVLLHAVDAQHVRPGRPCAAAFRAVITSNRTVWMR
jgi:hypothetical protein